MAGGAVTISFCVTAYRYQNAMFFSPLDVTSRQRGVYVKFMPRRINQYGVYDAANNNQCWL